MTELEMTNKTNYGASVNPKDFGGKLIDFDYPYVRAPNKAPMNWTRAMFPTKKDAQRYVGAVIKADRNREKGYPAVTGINNGPSIEFDHEVQVTYEVTND